MTMAMQRAKPIRMSPTMYCGWLCRNAAARPNISTGPITQFCTRDRPSTFQFAKAALNSSYRTLASGGYIIKIRPIAIGTFVVPT